MDSVRAHPINQSGSSVPPDRWKGGRKSDEECFFLNQSSFFSIYTAQGKIQHKQQQLIRKSVFSPAWIACFLAFKNLLENTCLRLQICISQAV